MITTSNVISPLSLLSDNPISILDQDKLKLEKIARLIARVAVGTEGPFTIGLFGGWGEGKTSALRLAKSLVDDTDKAKQGEIVTVEFNAWKYEKENLPLIPLIVSIIAELDNKKDTNGKMKEAFTGLKNGFRALLFGLSTQVDIKVPGLINTKIGLDVSKAIQREEELRLQWIDKQIDQCVYYNSFQTLQNIQQKIIVFIDDLDRCFPDKAIQLLENIKLILNQPGFIFVLAVDQRILENFLVKRFKDEFGFEDYQRGQSYLEKIIQLRLWIQSHEEWFKHFVKECLSRPTLSEYRTALESDPLSAEKISSACGYNPRRLIRFINDLEVAQLFDTEDNLPLNSFVVARSLRRYSANIYKWLLSRKDLCNKLKEFKNVDDLKNSLASLRNESSVHDEDDDLFQEMISKSFLLRLLASEPGREWLKNRWLQKSAEIVLDTYDQWIQEQVKRAWHQLSSDIEDDIVAACHTLTELPLPDSMHSKICQRLAELTNHSNPSISQEASYTYKAICAHRED